LKNPIEDLTIRVTCGHDNVEVRINLLGCFIHLITGSVRQLQIQKHEIEFLLPEAFHGLFSRIRPGRSRRGYPPHTCLARLQVGRNPGLAFGRTLQKWIASWNNKPAGKGPFKDSRASQRAWRVLGKPKDGQALYLKPDSLPSSSLEAILQRFAPKSVFKKSHA